MKTCTADDVLSWGFFFDDLAEEHDTAVEELEAKWIEDDQKRLVELLAGHERFTALDILRLEALGVDLRLKFVLEHELLDQRTERLWFAWNIEQRLLDEREAGKDPDEQAWSVVEATQRYIADELSKEEWDAAWNAIEGVAGQALTGNYEANVEKMIDLLDGQN